MDKQSSLFLLHELDRVVGGARAAVGRFTDDLESVPEQVMSWIESRTRCAGRALGEALYRSYLASQQQRSCCAAPRCNGPPGEAPGRRDGAELHAMVLHAEADAPLVQGQLLPALRRQGLRVATMPDVLELGLDLATALQRGLARVRRFLVLMSRAFLTASSQQGRLETSAMLQRRVDDLRSGGHSIIPLYVEEQETLAELAPALAGLVGMRFCDATSPAGLARLAHKLAAPDE